MKHCSAVIDTNIIVSGLLFGGVPLSVLKLGFNKKFHWFISPPLIEEMEHVLFSKKFSLSKEEIKILTTPLFDVVDIIIPEIKINVITKSLGDNRVLECAVVSQCDYIVTGDKRDLLSLESFENIKIITAKEFHNLFTEHTN